MSVNPAESEHVVLYLGLKHLDLVCHVAMVLMALLLRDNQGGNYELPVFLFPSQNSASLNLLGCVNLSSSYKLLNDFNRTYHGTKRARGRRGFLESWLLRELLIL